MSLTEMVSGARPPAPTVPTREFRRLQDGKYTWVVTPPGCMFTVDYLRRERRELIGELNVTCNREGVFADARLTAAGSLFTADYNFSGSRARTERAKILADRAKTGDHVDWLMYLEEFGELIFESERHGDPAVDLAELAAPPPDTTITLDGITLLKHHPVLLFGDGGAFKSYLALYLAGRLSMQGLRVFYADWELSADAHRDRLGRLFQGGPLPSLRYARCDKPLIHEVERLRRLTTEARSEYLICDSVGFACQGAPESAESTNEYFRAIRQIGLGSLQIAHVTKAMEGNDHKPFGSVFWHNGARATYYAQRTDEGEGPDFQVGIYPRKANMSERLKPTGFQIRFGPQRTWVTPIDLRNIPELAVKLSLTQRIAHAVRRAPQSLSVLAERLDAKEESIRRSVDRQPTRFQWGQNSEGVKTIQLVEHREEARP